jgi:hypothetical protein
MEIVKKIKTRYLWPTTLLFFVVLGLKTLASRGNPGISEVLQGQKFSLDFGLWTVGFFALSLATLSLAKGYEIFARTLNSPGKRSLKKDSSEMDIISEENNRLMAYNRTLQQQNEELSRKVQRLEEAFKERAGHEEMLKRSTIGLRREFEKVLAEKEKLSLELNQFNQKSLLPVKPKTAKKVRKSAPKKTRRSKK